MKRRNRLSKTNDIMRVRRHGTSYAHPLIVLMKLENDLEFTRIGVMTNKSLGGAVIRNRCKRQLRSITDEFLDETVPGWDLLLIARDPMPTAAFSNIRSTLQELLIKAGLLRS